jgi:hypothetical protein
MIAGLIKRLRDSFRTLSHQSLTRIITIDDPRWVLLSRVVMRISALSAIGMFIGIGLMSHPYFVVMGILVLLALASGIPVFLYERKISKREKELRRDDSRR